jgi:putative heme transporter
MGGDREATKTAGAQDSIEEHRAKRRRSMELRVLLQVLAIAAVAYFFIRERDLFTGFGAVLSSLVWSWVLLAALAELASVPPQAEMQRILLCEAGVEADRFQMNLVTLASNAISLSVPAGVAVAEGYSFVRYRRFGADPAVAAWSELASGAIAFSALAAVALVGALIAGGEAETILLPLLGVVLAGSVGAAILFKYPLLLVRGLEWLDSHTGRISGLLERFTSRFTDSARSLVHVRPTWETWGVSWGLSLANWLLDVVCLAFCFKAVGARIPWGAVLLAFAGSKVVTSVGITPGGLGLVEGGMVATFVAYGVPGADAGAAVLVYRALTLLGLVGIGWLVVAVLAFTSRRADARQTTEVDRASSR